MSFLNISGGVSNLDGNYVLSGKLSKQVETLKSSILIKPQKLEKEEDKYREFDNLADNSKLGQKPLNEKDLLAKGFKETEMITMNGGRMFYNPITKESVLIEKNSIGGSTWIEYKVGNMTHSATYVNGKETGGLISVKQEDGSSSIYQYSTGQNGTRFLEKKSSDKNICY